MPENKVFLDNLPTKNGVGKNVHKKVIDWDNSIGLKVKFIYKEVAGDIEIVKHLKKQRKVIIKYNNSLIEVFYKVLLNAELGRAIGYITSNFKLDINTNLSDEKRNINLVDKKIVRKEKTNGTSQDFKYYKYHCNKCNYEDWIEESHLLKGQGCSCCRGLTTVLGINTIWDTDRWMCDLGVSEEDAKKYTKGSNKKVTVTCPDCGSEKEIQINKINTYKSISCICGDGFSYPEKFMYSVLKQLNINFKTQLSKTTFEWCGGYRYDFYSSNYNMIIETHGRQHYDGNTNFKTSLKSIQENDSFKKKTALANGINKYMVIDCRESNTEYIKNSILNSGLAEIFDLSKVDWKKCEEFSLKNMVKEVCDYWNNKKEWETTTDLGKIFNMSRKTIRRYLTKGKELGLCNYDALKEKTKNNLKTHRKPKEVEVLKDGISLGIFESRKEIERISNNVFGVKLLSANISAVCCGFQLHHKGFLFQYIS